MKNSTFISDYQITLEIIKTATVKNIFYSVSTIWEKVGLNTDRISEKGFEFLTLISEQSNDFTKDIASNCLAGEYNPSTKQAWCLAYQIINNRSVYELAYIEFVEKEIRELYAPVKNGTETDVDIINIFKEIKGSDSDIAVYMKKKVVAE